MPQGNHGLSVFASLKFADQVISRRVHFPMIIPSSPSVSRDRRASQHVLSLSFSVFPVSPSTPAILWMPPCRLIIQRFRDNRWYLLFCGPWREVGQSQSFQRVHSARRSQSTAAPGTETVGASFIGFSPVISGCYVPEFRTKAKKNDICSTRL